MTPTALGPPNPATPPRVVLGEAGAADKIQEWQYERLAVVYVRQSDPRQVRQHQESTRLQYGLAARATALGWAPERVLVIDDDLGKSGTSSVGRPGFQRLVSEVSLDHVGLILGVEMSRLARSCKDWYHLLEICALYGTLLADLDGIYDPSQHNDRLLLGLKGTISEVELHVMQQRLRQGLLAKARRGALRLAPPMGYVVRPAGEIVLDPDEQVQGVIRLIFRKFAELGTVHALLRYLVAQRIELGMRARQGPEQGEVVWRRPSRATLQDILKHPMYAGAYVYGRRRVAPRRKQAGRPDTGRVVAPPLQWQVLLKDRLPAYVSWEQYERNLARLAANRAYADRLGVAREGAALLSRLVVCRYCGRHMAISYTAAGRHTYECARMSIDYGAPRCQTLAGACLDAFVSAQILAALEPAALDLSLAAAGHLERERADLDRLWQQKVERARYAAERAGRQYRQVEPEHRLVARQLEREWEERLLAQRQVEEEYRRFQQTQPRGLSAADQTAIRQLAADIPALWHAPTTTVAERKEIIRQVVERVEVAVQGESEQVAVRIVWIGGTQTLGTVVRPVARFSQLSYYAPLRSQVVAWAEAGVPCAEMARRLNAAGYRPPKRCTQFTAPIVQTLLRQIQHRGRRPPPPVPDGPGVDEWWLVDLAHHLGMPPVTLYHWLRRGGLRARQEQRAPHRWIVRADAAEVARLRARQQRPVGAATRQRWLTAVQPPVSTTDADPVG